MPGLLLIVFLIYLFGFLVLRPIDELMMLMKVCYFFPVFPTTKALASDQFFPVSVNDASSFKIKEFPRQVFLYARQIMVNWT